MISGYWLTLLLTLETSLFHFIFFTLVEHKITPTINYKNRSLYDLVRYKKRKEKGHSEQGRPGVTARQSVLFILKWRSRGTRASAKTCWPVSYNTRMSVMSALCDAWRRGRVERGFGSERRRLGEGRKAEGNGKNAWIRNERESGDEGIWEWYLLVKRLMVMMIRNNDK